MSQLGPNEVGKGQRTRPCLSQNMTKKRAFWRVRSIFEKGPPTPWEQTLGHSTGMCYKLLPSIKAWSGDLNCQQKVVRSVGHWNSVTETDQRAAFLWLLLVVVESRREVQNLCWEHKETRSKTLWGKQKQEAVLKATAVRSPLPVMLLILPCPPCLPQG